MTAWVSKQTGNWSRASNNADSPWYDNSTQSALSSYPGAGGSGDTVQIGDGVTASQVITLDADPANSLSTITFGDNTSYITVGTTRALTLTGSYGINCGSTLFGCVKVTAGTLTLTGGGAGTYVVNTTSSSKTIDVQTSGTLVISNSGGGALRSTSNGTSVYSTSAGSGNSITGSWSNTSSGACFYHTTGGGTWTVTGDVTCTGSAAAATFYLCTFNFAGKLISCAANAPNGVLVPVSGTFNWTGTYEIASGEDWSLRTGATCNLGTSGTSLIINNNGGRLVILVISGTLDHSYCTINNLTAAAQSAIMGHAVTVTGPSIPAAADVRYGVTRGYGDGGTSATAGCGVSGGNGLLEIPNSGTPTGTQDATSDACVVSGKKYGSPQRTGSAATGSGGGSGGFPRRLMKIG